MNPSRAPGPFGGRARAWARSVRFPSQLTILLPLVFGLRLAGPLDGAVLAAVLAFGLFDQLYIVWANDYADRFDDPLNRHPTPFAGGSRVLVEGQLSPRDLRNAALAAVAGMLVVTSALVATGAHPVLFGWAGLAVALLWAYSFPPIRLSYRGGGELLQTAGVGVVLPIFGYVAQAKTLSGFPWAALTFLVPLELGCAIATTRPDEEADRAVGKNTLAARWGGLRAGGLMVGAHFVAIGAFAGWRGELAPGVTILPLLLNFAALATVRARPGSRLMILHTFVALMVTVSFLALAIPHLGG